MLILSIESSCDETSASVVDGTTKEVKSNIISSQLFHSQYGGVIPELASRAHVESISFVVQKALSDANCTLENIDAFAVTTQPGLPGALLVGANFAKGLALKTGKPIFPINHIEAHLYSGFLESQEIEFPFVGLVVSGGHTSLFLVPSFSEYTVLGSTRDDAAGEAFDKIASMLGYQYPGGVSIDKNAVHGDPEAFTFPIATVGEFQFSFSGLKTSVRNFLSKTFSQEIPENIKPDICASVQHAITEQLLKGLNQAVRKFKPKTIVISGGVSANTSLRAKAEQLGTKSKIPVVIPKGEYCIDNAAMIGLLASYRYTPTSPSSIQFSVKSSSLRSPRK
jgi:N6-L-threonylcarbamoyladenine synthase